MVRNLIVLDVVGLDVPFAANVSKELLDYTYSRAESFRNPAWISADGWTGQPAARNYEPSIHWSTKSLWRSDHVVCDCVALYFKRSHLDASTLFSDIVAVPETGPLPWHR